MQDVQNNLHLFNTEIIQSYTFHTLENREMTTANEKNRMKREKQWTIWVHGMWQRVLLVTFYCHFKNKLTISGVVTLLFDIQRNMEEKAFMKVS